MSGSAPADYGRAGTQSIGRAVSILCYIAVNDGQGVRLVDVMRDLHLERSTAHRILACLVQERLAMVKQPNQRYVLGPLTYELGLRATRRNQWHSICRPFLERIAQSTGDVVFLSVRGGLESVCVDRAEGEYPIRAYTRQIGDRRPIGFGAVGICMIAPLPDEEVGRILNAGAESLQAFCGQSIDESWSRVKRARKHGFALNVRHKLGLRAIALPINGSEGIPVAAISVCAIASRLDNERAGQIADIVRSEIRSIEEALAHNEPGDPGNANEFRQESRPPSRL